MHSSIAALYQDHHDVESMMGGDQIAGCLSRCREGRSVGQMIERKHHHRRDYAHRRRPLCTRRRDRPFAVQPGTRFRSHRARSARVRRRSRDHKAASKPCAWTLPTQGGVAEDQFRPRVALRWPNVIRGNTPGDQEFWFVNQRSQWQNSNRGTPIPR